MRSVLVNAARGVALCALVGGAWWRSARGDVTGEPRLLSEKLRSGSITAAPDRATAGEFGTWVVTYRAGAEPIKTGGGLRVQLPEVWHAGLRNSGFPMQATKPSLPHYVSARCSNPGVELETRVESESSEVLVKAVKTSDLSRRQGYYVYVTRVVVKRGEVRSGDTLSLVYGDRSLGSTGYRAGVVASAPEPVLVAVDTEGRGEFRLHAEPPRLSIDPALPVEMLVTAHSEVVTGEKSTLHVAVLDSYANPATGFEGEIAAKVAKGEAELPSSVRLEPGRGWAEAAFVAKRTGRLRFQAVERSRHLEALSNPINVLAAKPETALFWGDLHSHTRFSVADAVGRGEDAYSYARHVSGLDFYAMTDHSVDSSPIAHGLTQREWQEYSKLAERFNARGQFVTLHAYEASLGAPYGHHNVFFRSQAGPLIPDSVSLPALWRALKAGEALTIPHHTLKMPEPIDWTGVDDPELRRNFEIYSGHGLSEEFNPAHPLAFEQSLFTNPSLTTRTGMSAQRAWAEGFRLSTIASSDEHRAHPGQPQYGLAAIRARSLSREDVFDGLHSRQTYGTTGARIILDFSVNGTPMGGQLETGQPVRIRGHAIGTDVIETVEVLRHLRGRPGFDVIHKVYPVSDEMSFEFADSDVHGDAVYYLRLRQRGLVRERIAMAWSSPVWVSVR